MSISYAEDTCSRLYVIYICLYDALKPVWMCELYDFNISFFVEGLKVIWLKVGIHAVEQYLFVYSNQGAELFRWNEMLQQRSRAGQWIQSASNS